MITRMFLALILGFHFTAFAAGQMDIDAQIANSIQKRWNDQPTMEKLFENFQKEMGPEMYSFLTAKMKSAGLLQAKPPKLEKNGDKSFAMDIGNSKIVIEIKSLANSTIVVNHHELTFKPNEKSSDIWKKIQAALPEKISSFFGLFLRDAYAMDKFPASRAQFSASTEALYGSMEAKSSCFMLNALLTQCRSTKTVVKLHNDARKGGEKSTLAADDIQHAKTVIREIEAEPVMQTSEPDLCEGGRSDVHSCIADFVAQAKKEMNTDLREGLPPTTTSPDSGKTIR